MDIRWEGYSLIKLLVFEEHLLCNHWVWEPAAAVTFSSIEKSVRQRAKKKGIRSWVFLLTSKFLRTSNLSIYIYIYIYCRLHICETGWEDNLFLVTSSNLFSFWRSVSLFFSLAYLQLHVWLLSTTDKCVFSTALLWVLFCRHNVLVKVASVFLGA